eukprot:scaffold2639_cov385-Prasinococcus_capsulatus_cf.AAC.18
MAPECSGEGRARGTGSLRCRAVSEPRKMACGGSTARCPSHGLLHLVSLRAPPTIASGRRHAALNPRWSPLVPSLVEEGTARCTGMALVLGEESWSHHRTESTTVPRLDFVELA